jgi:hypothetical protein
MANVVPPWDVENWLRGLGLGQYEATFHESEISADVLSDLTELDLKKRGLPLDIASIFSKRLKVNSGSDLSLRT